MKSTDTKTQPLATDFDQLSDDALAGVNGGVDLSGLLGYDEGSDSPFSEPMVASFFHIKWPQRK